MRALVYAALMLATSPAIGAEEVAPERQAMILTRALAYDNHLKSRAGDSLVVAVLYKADNSASKTSAEAIHRAWRAMDNVRVQELPMRIILVPWVRGEGTVAALAGNGVDVLYVCAGLEGELGVIKELSRRQHLISIGAREDFVQAGLSLGLVLADGKPVLTVNLPASRDEGAAFGSELLRLARVIK
jgi:hypothetical protein